MLQVACTRFAPYILVGTLVALCFGSSLFGQFVFDDAEALLQNPDLDSTSPLWLYDIFKHDFWGNNLTDKSSHKSYRPLTILAFKCIRQLGAAFSGSTRLNPKYYHGANLVVYYLLCCLLHSTIHTFLLSPIINFSSQRAKHVALLVTLLFTCHPVHCEPVVSCVGLADILSGLCCVLSFRLYLAQVNRHFSTKNGCTPSQIARTFLLSFTAVVFAAVGLFCKEQGITFLGIFLLLDCYLLVTCRHLKRSTRAVILAEVALYALSTMGLLYWRLWIMNFSPPSFSQLDNPASHVTDLLYRCINYGYVHLLNAFITVCPIWLCFDWSMGCIALIESPGDPRFALLISIVILLLLLFVRLIYLSITRREERCLLIFTTFSVLPFLPSSNIFFPVGFVLAERNLFMPILGYLLIFVTSFHWCLAALPPSKRKICQYFFYFIVITYSLRCFNRTKVWLNEGDLFENDVQVCPRNAKIFYNIAKIAADSGQVEKAVDNYRHSLALHENYTSALNNYANILKEQGKLIEAKGLLEKACTLEPHFAAALMNLAIVEMSLGNHQQSEMYFQRTILIRPNHATSHFNLGNLYLEGKRFAEAIQAYSRAVELNPHLVRAWNNLILLQHNHNRTDTALQLANRAIALNPEADSLHFLAGNILGGGSASEMSLSEQHFKQAITIKPQAPYHYNLGVLYHRQNLLEQAKVHYALTLQLNPQHKGAIRQMRVLTSILSTGDEQT